MKQLVFALLGVSLAVPCSAQRAKIVVTAEPVTAPILVDRQAVGLAPLQVQVTFKKGSGDTSFVVAVPTTPEECAQWHAIVRGAPAPDSIHFDMRSCLGRDTTTLMSNESASSPSRARSMPALEYPTKLRNAGVNGTVLVEVTIDSTGVVDPRSIRVKGASLAGFVLPALKGVLGAEFEPAIHRGYPVAVRAVIPVNFQSYPR